VEVGLEHQALQGLLPVMIQYLAPLQAQAAAAAAVIQTPPILLLAMALMVVLAVVVLGRRQ
jgi:hypothetical protein